MIINSMQMGSETALLIHNDGSETALLIHNETVEMSIVQCAATNINHHDAAGHADHMLDEQTVFRMRRPYQLTSDLDYLHVTTPRQPYNCMRCCFAQICNAS